MDPDEVLARLPGEWRLSLERQLVQINRNYMAALSRTMDQPIQTILIRHALGYYL
jgi:hypothetical protein